MQTAKTLCMALTAVAVCAASPASDAAAPEGRRLNNFVRELVDAPLVDGAHSFTLPAAGWVYVGFDAPHFGAEVRIDGGERPVLAYRSDEPPGTMRHLAAGTHKVEIAGAPKGGGRLFVRAVKTYRHAPSSFAMFFSDISDPENGCGFEFCRRWLFPAYNTFAMCKNWRRESKAWGDGFLDLYGKAMRSAAETAADDAAGPQLAAVTPSLAGLAPDDFSADAKWAYDRYLHRLAVAADGRDIAGLSVPAYDEETSRWIARLVRHYGIEGRTDSLAERFGFVQRPAHIANGGFTDGLAGWDASPARLSQRIRDLKPGSVYAVTYRISGAAPSASVSGAEPLPGLAQDSVAAHRRVFRASSPEAELAFTDWKGGDGRRRIDCVAVKPYYVESAEELSILLAMSTHYDSAKEARFLAAVGGRACGTERTTSTWAGPREILATHPDRVVYIPEQPQRFADRSPARRGDSFNDHFQVIYDPKRKLLYAFWTQATKEAAPDQHIAFSKSADNGLTWTPPVILAGSETRARPLLVASWQQPMLAKSGRLYCLWNQQTTSRGPHIGVIFGSFSDDAGETWSPPKLVNFPRRHELADRNPAVPPSWCNWQRPLRLAKGGRFLVGSSYHGRIDGVPGSRTRVEFWRFENIDDDPKVEDIRISCFPAKDALDADQVDSSGARLYAPRKGSTSDVAIEEAAIVKLPDGRLFALCRSSVGYPVWSVSADGGESWSRLKILRDRDGGTPFLHPRSPCPLYDWKGPEAGSGRYFALVHDAFDFYGERAYQTRGPLHFLSGRFDPKADQPIVFKRCGLFSPRSTGNSCYSSYTCVDGKGTLWYNDRKFFLLGREIADSFFTPPR